MSHLHPKQHGIYSSLRSTLMNPILLKHKDKIKWISNLHLDGAERMKILSTHRLKLSGEYSRLWLICHQLVIEKWSSFATATHWQAHNRLKQENNEGSRPTQKLTASLHKKNYINKDSRSLTLLLRISEETSPDVGGIHQVCDPLNLAGHLSSPFCRFNLLSVLLSLKRTRNTQQHCKQNGAVEQMIATKFDCLRYSEANVFGKASGARVVIIVTDI